MDWINVNEKLPNDNEKVLIWNGSVEVARFVKGITEEERRKMENGELPNPKSEYWCQSNGYTLIERSKVRKSCDVWANNLVPYCWEVNGGASQIFGQNISYWQPIPKPPKQ